MDKEKKVYPKRNRQQRDPSVPGIVGMASPNESEYQTLSPDSENSHTQKNLEEYSNIEIEANELNKAIEESLKESSPQCLFCKQTTKDIEMLQAHHNSSCPAININFESESGAVEVDCRVDLLSSPFFIPVNAALNSPVDDIHESQVTPIEQECPEDEGMFETGCFKENDESIILNESVRAECEACTINDTITNTCNQNDDPTISEPELPKVITAVGGADSDIEGDVGDDEIYDSEEEGVAPVDTTEVLSLAEASPPSSDQGCGKEIVPSNTDIESPETRDVVTHTKRVTKPSLKIRERDDILVTTKASSKNSVIDEKTVVEDKAEADENLFCTCRQPYKEGDFMLDCCKCQEWFHPICIEYSCAKCTDELNLVTKTVNEQSLDIITQLKNEIRLLNQQSKDRFEEAEKLEKMLKSKTKELEDKDKKIEKQQQEKKKSSNSLEVINRRCTSLQKEVLSLVGDKEILQSTINELTNQKEGLSKEIDAHVNINQELITAVTASDTPASATQEQPPGGESHPQPVDCKCKERGKEINSLKTRIAVIKVNNKKLSDKTTEIDSTNLELKREKHINNVIMKFDPSSITTAHSTPKYTPDSLNHVPQTSQGITVEDALPIPEVHTANKSKESQQQTNGDQQQSKAQKIKCVTELTMKDSCTYKANCHFSHNISDDERKTHVASAQKEKEKATNTICINEFLNGRGSCKELNCSKLHNLDFNKIEKE